MALFKHFLSKNMKFSFLHRLTVDFFFKRLHKKSDFDGCFSFVVTWHVNKTMQINVTFTAKMARNPQFLFYTV